MLVTLLVLKLLKSNVVKFLQLLTILFFHFLHKINLKKQEEFYAYDPFPNNSNLFNVANNNASYGETANRRIGYIRSYNHFPFIRDSLSSNNRYQHTRSVLDNPYGRSP